MNKNLLAQQVDVLRWSEKMEDIMYNSVNIAQFCLQQLLVDDADTFLDYIASQSELQNIFGNIQKIVDHFLKMQLNECNDGLRKKISQKIEQSETRTPVCLEKLNEKARKSEVSVSKEEELRVIESEMESLEEEQQSIHKKIQDLKMIQAKLSEYNIRQMEKNLKEFKIKVGQEKELYSKEERKEKQLAGELQLLIDTIPVLVTKIEDKSKDVIKTTADILDKKKESVSKKGERLHRLKRREQQYIECHKNSIKMYSDSKAHLSENEKIEGQIKTGHELSDNQKQLLDGIKNNFWQKMSEIEQLNHLLNDNISQVSFENINAKENV